MNHKQEWEDMKKWIEKGMAYFDERKEKTEEGSAEYNRLKNKREGFNVCLQYMKDTERIHKGE